MQNKNNIEPIHEVTPPCFCVQNCHSTKRNKKLQTLSFLASIMQIQLDQKTDKFVALERLVYLYEGMFPEGRLQMDCRLNPTKRIINLQGRNCMRE